MAICEILVALIFPLFDGILPEDRKAMMGCIGYHISAFRKGDIIAFEEENIRHAGIVFSGTVDMVKEDIRGNKIMPVRTGKDELLGETFACGSHNLLLVTFPVSEDAEVWFLSFDRVMHSCSMACMFHHRLIGNMVRIIENKNRDLIRKVELVSKCSIRKKVLTYLFIRAQIQGPRYFEIPLGRMELAEFLCVDRSALARELVKMKADGLIDYDRSHFRMLKIWKIRQQIVSAAG